MKTIVFVIMMLMVVAITVGTKFLVKRIIRFMEEEEL